MSTHNELLEGIYECLGINDNSGLIAADSLHETGSFQMLFYSRVHEKLGIESVFFLRDLDGVPRVPLIYFSFLDKYDPVEIAELHRLAWNLGEAPLLFVVTPDQILIYNNYQIPVVNEEGELDPLACLIETLSLAEGLASQRKALLRYHRSSLESGEFWRQNNDRFSIQNRVDSTLITNLKVMRKTLVFRMTKNTSEDDTTISQVVHALLCRSILIRYLEERKDSNGDAIFPDGYFAEFLANAKCYTDILQNKEATYSLFDALKNKFNGDVFQVENYEPEVVRQEDLDELRLFLLGECDLKNNQLALWPLYSFDVIPIQLISSMYEMFFHLSDRDDNGTYYTPLHLVNLLMDEVYPWEGKYVPVRFFDPSCGSGIFLVEAYRRLIGRWMRNNENNCQTIDAKQLIHLLQESIFGVDINQEAVRIAAFSLYLVMCDFLDNRSIWHNLTFPSLLNKNLFVSDFFDLDQPFNDHKFDVIIGNPPWTSNITPKTKEYLQQQNYVIGDKQIAQAFTYRCPELCKDKGIICLLMPSKALLFNRSNRNKQYRKTLFENNSVILILNLSLHRGHLFVHGSGPAAALVYAPKNSEPQDVVYCTPKPTYVFDDSRSFCIDPNDISILSPDVALTDNIWKITMWGTPRDLELIERMRQDFNEFRSFIHEHKMIVAEGFIRGNGKKECSDFKGLPLLETKTFQPYFIEANDLPITDFSGFVRTAESAREIFKAPHLIIKKSPKNATFVSEVLPYDAVFSASFIGVHGDVRLLKYLSVIIGSKVFSYYHILTSGKWLVERDELEASDILQMPIPEPATSELSEACKLFDALVESPENNRDAEEFVRRIYGMNESERYHVDDVIESYKEL